jgi:hypothetical protein
MSVFIRIFDRSIVTPGTLYKNLQDLLMASNIQVQEAYIMKRIPVEDIPELLGLNEFNVRDIRKISGDKYIGSFLDSDNQVENTLALHSHTDGKFLCMEYFLFQEHFFGSLDKGNFSYEVINDWNKKHFGAVSTAYIDRRSSNGGDIATLRNIIPVWLGVPVSCVVCEILLFNQAVSNFNDFLKKEH